MTTASPARRQLLAGVGVVVVSSLAGCSSDEGDENPDESDDAGNNERNPDDDGTSPNTGDPDGDELDLREANVVDVSYDGNGESYSFDVTLHHDDNGEDGYANWWQVERLDGARLGRRDLSHPHSRQPFTRSATVEVAESVTCVVVRGHDQTHGYGGRALLLNLESGTGRAVEQGVEPEAFDSSDCP